MPACKAAPSPAIGQALGALGVNMMEFCKAFNKRTEAFKDNTLLPVILTAYTDRSFEFQTKTPPVSWFIKQAVELELGSGLAGAMAHALLYSAVLCRARIWPIVPMSARATATARGRFVLCLIHECISLRTWPHSIFA